MMMAAVPFLIQSFTKRGSVYGAFCPVQNSSVRGEEPVFVGMRRPDGEGPALGLGFRELVSGKSKASGSEGSAWFPLCPSP